MLKTFDDKVYNIIKSGKSNVIDVPNGEKPNFNQVFPVGSVFMFNKSECPLKYGTWELTGIYGTDYHDWTMASSFDKDHVLFHILMDSGGQNEWKIGFNAYLGSSSAKALLGQSYTSPQSGVDPNTYYNFYDDKGGWYSWFPDSSHMTVHGDGLTDTTRRYELSVLVKIDDLVTAANVFKDMNLTYEFTRKE